MSQKIVLVPGIGNVLIAKRRGTKNLKLSIRADGTVRVGMPPWLPYSTGQRFALSHSEWIARRLSQTPSNQFKNGQSIGKAYTLYFHPGDARTRSRITPQRIDIYSSLDLNSETVQHHALKTCERALKQEAQRILPNRLQTISNRYNLAYTSVNIKKLRSKWGSCSHDKAVSLNYYLMQLPWHLIDYVLIHELVHTRYLSHNKDFWSLLEQILPESRQFKKDIKKYYPALVPEAPL